MSKKKQVVFKTYTPTQAFLLPPSLDELIIATHPVRVVNDVIDRINLAPLEKQYEGGGSSSYHPKMLLKVLIYGYVTNVYSSRKLEAACKENIHFMWLAGMNKPDHHTINRFRRKRLKESLRSIFVQVVELLASEGLLSIKEIYTDGTKIESVANRYTFVWGKAMNTNKEKIKKQLDELWEYAKQVAAEEMSQPEPPDFTTIDSEKVKQTIEKIDAVLADKPVRKEIKQKLKYAKKNWPAALDKYAEQEQILDGRNSYSKTDTDATFMRMKEDHMKNGQLKPAYNIQISSSNQYIVNYSVHANPTDTTTLPSHLDQHYEMYNQYPEAVTADAGYGSEQNYTYMETNSIEAFVKYNYFDKQQSEKYFKKHPFAPETLHYNETKDCYYCPMGQQMHCIGEGKRTTKNGFVQHTKKYQAKNCESCPLRGVCHDSKQNRIIEVNHKLNQIKREAHARLNSEIGIAHRKKRCCDVEPIFGNIKGNHGFKRFLLKGNKKVSIEFGLLAIAQNLRKKAS